MNYQLYLYCAAGLITLILIVYLILKRKVLLNKFSNFISDILKEKTTEGLKFSQGRFYLMASLAFYFFILTLISIKGIMPDVELNTKFLELVIDSLQWIIGLFSGYVMGTKGLEVLNLALKNRTGAKTQDTIPTKPIPPSLETPKPPQEERDPEV